MEATALALQGNTFPMSGVVLILVICLPAMAYLGHRLGHGTRVARGYDTAPPAVIPGEQSLGAIMGLLGLLLAFSFGATLNWSQQRNHMVVEEGAALGTAFLRADLLEEPGKGALQQALFDYALTREEFFNVGTNRADIADALETTVAAQAELWPATMAAFTPETPAPVRTFVAGGITDVLDAHTRRIAAGSETLPNVAKVMLLATAMIALLLLGNRSGLQGRPLTWRTFTFSAILLVVMLVTLDLDRANEGLMIAKSAPIEAAVADMRAMLE